MKEAAYQIREPDGSVRCLLCPHHCRITKGRQGLCLTRGNRDGILYSLNYCRPVSTAVDPVEKKPLYHFHPGGTLFSTGPNGCTFRCSFCQNHEISQRGCAAREYGLNELLASVTASGARGIAYTYSEPYIWFETIMDLGPLVKESGLVNVLITNGYMEPDPLDRLSTVIDAMNIDIKSMNPAFYRNLCKGELEPVLRTCETVKKKCHLEITNLLITGENESDTDIRKIAGFIAANLGKDTPLHLSRYFPRYKMTAPATDEAVVYRARQIASEYLDYVYIGNISVEDGSSTRCPRCTTLLIRRSGYSTVIMPALLNSTNGKGTCKTCGNHIPVILGPA